MLDFDAVVHVLVMYLTSFCRSDKNGHRLFDLDFCPIELFY